MLNLWIYSFVCVYFSFFVYFLVLCLVEEEKIEEKIEIELFIVDEDVGKSRDGLKIDDEVV